jgi:hypothetical protein
MYSLTEEEVFEQSNVVISKRIQVSKILSPISNINPRNPMSTRTGNLFTGYVFPKNYHNSPPLVRIQNSEGHPDTIDDSAPPQKIKKRLRMKNFAKRIWGKIKKKSQDRKGVEKRGGHWICVSSSPLPQPFVKDFHTTQIMKAYLIHSANAGT